MSLTAEIPTAANVRPTPTPAQVMRCGGIDCAPGTCDHTDDPADAVVHRSADGSGVGCGTVPQGVLRVLDTPGTPLDSSVRTAMETRLGHDFGRVRVHTDAEAARSARSIQAHAYAFGSHVVMGAGRYQPHTHAGDRLLTHELTHVVQQAGVSGRPAAISDPGDTSEREAGEAEEAALTRRAARAIRAPMPFRSIVQRACGAAEIGSVSGCAERGGDIADYGRSSDDLFLFVRDCDDLAPGESARLAEYVAHIGADDDVSIDGFASEEGPAEYNNDLACARSRAAADVLMRFGVVPRSLQLYSHGATPGERMMHRSVVITATPPPQSPAPVPTPTPTPAPSPPTPGKTYSFNITTDGAADQPYIQADVVAAAREAFDTVSRSGCVSSASLKDDILSEFDGLNIDCEQGDAGDPCGMASRYFTHTVNIYPKSLDPTRCGPLASTILHEVVHLTEWRLFGHGELADACEKACFGFGSGDPSKCQ